jgi:WD40 repeat protein
VTTEFSPDGTTFLTAGRDGIAKLFDAATGKKLHSFTPAQWETRPELTAASFSPDGSLVLTVASTGEVRLYDAATEADLGLLSDEGPYEQALWGTVGGRLVVLTSDWDQPARLWDARNRSLLATYGTDPSGGASLSPDGRYVVTVEYVAATENSRASVWDARSGRLLERSPAVGAYASVARFVGTKWDRIVFFAIKENAFSWHPVVWEWHAKANTLRTMDAGGRVGAVPVVSNDGRLLAAPMDKRVRIFDADTAELVGETADTPDWVNDVSFSPDGHWLATAGNDGQARAWMSEQINNRPLAELIGHRGAVIRVGFDPHSDWRLITAGDDGTARTWELPERTVLPGSGSWLLGAELSSDGQHLVTAEDGGDLHIYSRTLDAGPKNRWKLASQDVLNRDGRLMGASFSPDGTEVVAAEEFSYAPLVWNWQSSDYADDDLERADDLIGKPVVSADGRSVAAGDSSGKLIVWNLESKKITAEFAGAEDGYQAPVVAVVPRSDWFAEGGTDGVVRLWDPDEQDAPQKAFGEKGGSPLEAVKVSADGAYLVTVSEKQEVKVWRLSDGESIWAFDGPSSTNSDAAFSADGKLLAVSAADGTVHIWRLADGHKVALLHRHGDYVNSVQFTADGSLVTASDDSTVAMFPCTTCGDLPDLIKTAQDRVATNKR